MLLQKDISRQLELNLRDKLHTIEMSHSQQLHLHGDIAYKLYALFRDSNRELHGCLYYDILFRIVQYNKKEST